MRVHSTITTQTHLKPTSHKAGHTQEPGVFKWTRHAQDSAWMESAPSERSLGYVNKPGMCSQQNITVPSPDVATESTITFGEVF